MNDTSTYKVRPWLHEDPESDALEQQERSSFHYTLVNSVKLEIVCGNLCLADTEYWGRRICVSAGPLLMDAPVTISSWKLHAFIFPKKSRFPQCDASGENTTMTKNLVKENKKFKIRDISGLISHFFFFFACQKLAAEQDCRGNYGLALKQWTFPSAKCEDLANYHFKR